MAQHSLEYPCTGLNSVEMLYCINKNYYEYIINGLYLEVSQSTFWHKNLWASHLVWTQIQQAVWVEVRHRREEDSKEFLVSRFPLWAAQEKKNSICNPLRDCTKYALEFFH